MNTVEALEFPYLKMFSQRFYFNLTIICVYAIVFALWFLWDIYVCKCVGICIYFAMLLLWFILFYSVFFFLLCYLIITLTPFWLFEKVRDRKCIYLGRRGEKVGGFLQELKKGNLHVEHLL